MRKPYINSDRVFELWKLGLRTQVIAKRLGVNSYYILKILKLNGLEPNSRLDITHGAALLSAMGETKHTLHKINGLD